MSDFFDWIGDFAPMLIWILLWVLIAPIRVVLLMCMPYNSDKYRHWAHPVYDFLAFEKR